MSHKRIDRGRPPIVALVLCSSSLGCIAIFGIDAPIRAPDAAVEGAVDGAVDAPPDATPDAPPACPMSYTLTLAASSTRYKLVTLAAPFATQHAGCNADQPGRTHLASLDSIAEIDALRSVVAATMYIGAVQAPNQASLTTGWVTLGGGPLPLRWNAGAPDDIDGVENGQQNVASIDAGGISDRTAPDSFRAVCECDGIAIDPTALSYVP